MRFRRAPRETHQQVVVVSHDGGGANTVVFLKNITQGKAMDLPQQRQSLNQKSCRYEPTSPHSGA